LKYRYCDSPQSLIDGFNIDVVVRKTQHIIILVYLIYWLLIQRNKIRHLSHRANPVLYIIYCSIFNWLNSSYWYNREAGPRGGNDSSGHFIKTTVQDNNKKRSLPHPPSLAAGFTRTRKSIGQPRWSAVGRWRARAGFRRSASRRPSAAHDNSNAQRGRRCALLSPPPPPQPIQSYRHSPLCPAATASSSCSPRPSRS